MPNPGAAIVLGSLLVPAGTTNGEWQYIEYGPIISDTDILAFDVAKAEQHFSCVLAGWEFNLLTVVDVAPATIQTVAQSTHIKIPRRFETVTTSFNHSNLYIMRYVNEESKRLYMAFAHAAELIGATVTVAAIT